MHQESLNTSVRKKYENPVYANVPTIPQLPDTFISTYETTQEIDVDAALGYYDSIMIEDDQEAEIDEP